MTRTLIALLLTATSATAAAQNCGNYSVEELTPEGGRVDWSPHGQGDMIAFDHDVKEGRRDGYFDVSVMSVRDKIPTCITCTPAALAEGGLKGNKGQPAWHPSGEYIVFQAEIENSGVGAKRSNPGRGVGNVLWLTDPAGTWFVQLTDYNSDGARGVLHPHFHVSEKGGTQLSWSEMYAPWHPAEPGQGAGLWRLKKATLNLDVFPPRLEQMEELLMPERMRPGFYENHGFSPDGGLIIFSSNALRDGVLDSINNDIFTFDLASGAVTRLTDMGYNEHASFFPDGRHVLWMTNRRNPDRGTDLWVMERPRLRARDQRLTYFNVAGCPGAEEGQVMIVADSSLNAAGTEAVVFVQRGLFDDGGPIFRVTLPPLPF
jgi:hypothetical protein